jgi:hypothetical protein
VLGAAKFKLGRSREILRLCFNEQMTYTTAEETGVPLRFPSSKRMVQERNIIVGRGIHAEPSDDALGNGRPNRNRGYNIHFPFSGAPGAR